ncbi:MAG: AMP-binding protein [Chitinophagaceae bacterium]
MKSKGVKGEMLVPICMGQSMEMIVAILGIQKAGGAYVPIDPNYPKERDLTICWTILPSLHFDKYQKKTGKN